MTTVLAVYENGVLRPSQPLDLAEGQQIHVTVHCGLPGLSPPSLPPPTPEEQAYAERLKAAKSLEEMFAVMESAPETGEDFDIVKEINESRRLTGFRMPDPEPAGEEPR
jgi:predicted DNA-binding antitoxin AbrB/MazE fold protein